MRFPRFPSGFISSPVTRVVIGAGLIGLMAAGCGGDENRGAPPAETSRPPETASTTTPPAGSETGGNSGFGVETIPDGDPRLNDIDFLRTLPPTYEADVALGNAFIQHGQLDSAAAAYRRAAERDPDDPRGWNFLGIALARMERLDEAEAAYRKAVDADAFFLNTHINLGNLYFKRDDIDRAILEYTMATNIDSTVALAWRNLGLAFERTEFANDAIHAYVKVIECDQADPMPWERLGWMYYDRKMFKAARERWAGAVERDPTRTDLVDNIRRLEDYADSTGTR